MLWRLAPAALLVLVGVPLVVGVRTFHRFRPVAMTLGPETTLYLTDAPPLSTRVHEAIHRRQMRDKTVAGRLLAALRYNFDYAFRLDEEAEAKAGELCLQIHNFSSALPAYTTARSAYQAREYRAWFWERSGLEVPDRVGEKLGSGEGCARIFRGVTLDLPPDAPLSEKDSLSLATFHFLQSYGSSDTDVAAWKARLELAGYADPVAWSLPEGTLSVDGLGRAEAEAAPSDSTISPERAGRALHRLTYYRALRMYAQLQPPVAGYRLRPLFQGEELERAVGLTPERWPVRLVRRALDDELHEHATAALQAVADHPVNADFETFALAPEADVVGTRYRLPSDGGWSRLATTEREPVAEAFQAQSGRIALAAARGDLAGAEAVARVKVAGALQFIRNAPFRTDVLDGMGYLRDALDELRLVLRARGEDDPLAWLDDDGGFRLDGWREVLFSGDATLVYRALPALAGDVSIPHALRRFAFRQIVLFDVCLSLSPDPGVRREHQRWTDAVEAGLVRRESDRQVLELMRSRVRGLLGRADVDPRRICAPDAVARPGARMAIISSPPRFALGGRAAAADD